MIRSVSSQRRPWIPRGTVLVAVFATACAGLLPESEPHPPGCGPGVQARSSVQEPMVRVAPKLPPSARRNASQGFVCMNFTVQPDGSVADICVADQLPTTGLFDRQAAEALSQWKFERGAAAYPNGACMQFYTQ